VADPTPENKGFLVYDKRFGIGRTIKMGDSWCTKAGDLCVGFFDLKATEHPPILPILVPFASVRIIPAHVQVQLEESGRADVRNILLTPPESTRARFGTVPIPLREPDPKLLDYLRKHQSSVVPDRRVYFDQPQHGFSSAVGRLLCDDGESLIAGIDKDGNVLQGNAEVDYRKDGPFLNVLDPRETHLEHKLEHYLTDDALNSDKNKPPAVRPDSKGSDRFPTPPSHRSRLLKFAAEGVSKDDLETGAVTVNGERRKLNGMFDYRQFTKPKPRKPKAEKPAEPTRPVISWMPEASAYVKPADRELSSITQLWNAGYGPTQIAKKLRKSDRTVRRRLEYLLANEPKSCGNTAMEANLPEIGA
jgi:hypothetical protein